MEAKFHTSIRLAQDVRAKLLDSARLNGRSLSGEINHRLRMVMNEARNASEMSAGSEPADI